MKIHYRYLINISAILMLVLLFQPGCSKENETEVETFENEIDTTPYQGTYRIEPTAGKTLFLDLNGRVIVNDNDGSVIQEGRYSTGKATLRIFFNGNSKPDAVFLLDDYTENGWRGRWGEDMKILYRN